jgi:hypothetical protein
MQRKREKVKKYLTNKKPRVGFFSFSIDKWGFIGHNRLVKFYIYLIYENWYLSLL